MTTLLVPFQFSSAGRAATTSDEARIAEQQILDVLVTGAQERVMRPVYGAGVVRHLFEPMNDLIIADASQDALLRLSQLTTCTVKSLVVKPRDNGMAMNGQAAILDVLVTYSLPANPVTFEMRTALTTYVTEETAL